MSVYASERAEDMSIAKNGSAWIAALFRVSADSTPFKHKANGRD